MEMTMKATTPQSEDPKRTPVSGRDELAQTAADAKATAQRAASDAGALGRDAMDAGVEKVSAKAAEASEYAKTRASNELDRTARALGAAADELESDSFQRDILREAADGLTGLSRAVDGKSAGEMVGELSRFGRDNPAAFLGGAMLAGFAIGRFARAGAPEAHQDVGQGPRNRRPADPTVPAGAPMSAEPISPYARGGDDV